MRTANMLALAALAAGTAMASADIVTFEGLAHGEVITDQYASIGLDITVVNFNKPFNAGVAFNSNLSGTDDPDLEHANWTVGNIADASSPGNLLIIQESILGVDSGFASDPDDEAGRAAGTITLDFAYNLSEFGFDVFDVDSETKEASSVEFYSDGTLVFAADFSEFIAGSSPIGAQYGVGVQYGDASANRISPISADTDFNRVVFNVGGSMGFDSFNYTVVPAPSAGLALGGLTLLTSRRRRR